MARKQPGRGRTPRVVRGSPSVQLTRREFRERWLERFYDPAFEAVSAELEAAVEVAWQAYRDYRKSPRVRRAGKAFADPAAELPREWLAARRAIGAAQRAQRRRGAPSRFLLINGSSRSDQTCPGELSKSHRLLRIAARAIQGRPHCEVDELDLSLLTSQAGRVIHPCKACVSTAMPLCHWPCSCYPNHALGQVNDWMNELYPRWVAAHGVLIVTPVHWLQAPSVLKLMIDRLVCADGGNPDPTTTGGKDPARAKALELAGWHYPKHLAGRAFAVVVHGDAEGVESLGRNLCDWLTAMQLVQAGPSGLLARYLGYYRSYATSHDDLDADLALQQETRNTALSLVERVRQIRSGRYRPPDEHLSSPRPK
jgi:multimeric flavodoxin WrbA